MDYCTAPQMKNEERTKVMRDGWSERKERGIICSVEIFHPAAVIKHTHTLRCKSEAFPDSAFPPLI